MITSNSISLAELNGGPATSILHIRDLFIKTTEQYPDVEAVVSIHQASLGLPKLDDGAQESPLRWSYSQLYQGAIHLASRLEALGVPKGSAIAFFSENRAEWVLICWASVLLRCPFVPLNPQLANNKEEVTYVLSQIEPSVVIATGQEQWSLLEMHARQNIEQCLLVSLEEIVPTTLEKALSWMTLKQLWSESSTPISWKGRLFEDTAVIGFTSGTTSHPKACPQSSENLMTSAVAVRDARNIGPKDRLCQHLPGFAAMAVLINLTCCISGATIVYPSSSFSATASLDAIEREQCTYTFAAPAIVKALAMHPSVAGRSLKSLRIVELGGAPIYPEILHLATSKDGLNCERVGCGWGMTESPCPLLAEPWKRTFPLPKDYIPVGAPILGTQVKICALESEKPVRGAETGELHVGGPQVIRGYLNCNTEAFYTDVNGTRWIKTGDMARIENGQVYIIGRYKDIIIRGGHNISPTKIERCLERVPKVEVQVVGVIDDIAGEVPVAVIKTMNGATANCQKLFEHLRKAASKELGLAEQPSTYLTLEDLRLDNFPSTLSGKVQKGMLSKIVWEYLKNKTNHSSQIAGNASTADNLVHLWATVSGINGSTISPVASIFTFADSITTMRLSSLVKKQLRKDLSVDDITKHPSIVEQAALLDSRPVRTSTNPLTTRLGPPPASEMVHCQGSDSMADATKEVTLHMLRKLGLSWNDDVEDVFPAPDTSYIYLNRQRPQTWNQRVIYLAPHHNVEALTRAWKAILIHHSMFRTVAVPTQLKFAGVSHLFVVLRPNSNFWNCSIVTDLEVETPEDLRGAFLNEWADTFSGPLVRVAFVRIKKTESSAFILVGNHAAYDNLSMDLIIEDLKTALEHNLTKDNILYAPGHVTFKRFADTYFSYRSSKEAMEVAAFHANRLQGIGSNRDSLWPKSRAPGFFKGQDDGWTHPSGTPGDASLRAPLDPPNDRHGLDGLTRTAPVKTLRAMRERYGIMPHVILKVAVALFNMRQTGTCTAMFANVEAGRKWPSASSDEELPNPLGIAGPMFQVVLNRISIQSQMETAVDVLRRAQHEQALLTQHSQAPLFQIASSLTAPDQEVFFDALARQGYNWAPGIQSGSKSSEKEKQETLYKFNRQALDDIGLAWTCGLWDPETFYVNGSYDDCQLAKEEVKDFVGQVLAAGIWLADPENAERRVGECAFDANAQVSGLMRSLE